MADDHPQYTSSPDQWDKLKPVAREMRHVPTPAEDSLWQHLRNRRVRGSKFRRQHAFGRYIVDFVCIDSRLIVEVDGPIHERTDRQAYDAERRAFLEAQGFHILRITNDEVLGSPNVVLKAIEAALSANEPPNTTSP